MATEQKQRCYLTVSDDAIKTLLRIKKPFNSTSKTFQFNSKLTQIQLKFQIQIQILPPFKMFQNVPKVSKSKQTQFKTSEDHVKQIVMSSF